MANGKPYPVELKMAEGKKKKNSNETNESKQKEKLMYILPDIKIEQK